MPNYRRDRTPGGTYFFTVCLKDRTSRLLTDNIGLLRRSVAGTMAAEPFCIDAWVVLPDHMHCIWTLPPGDSDYSNRWKSLKGRFSRAMPDLPRFRKAAVRPREKGIWQNRFWEHRIRDQRDLQTHIRYCYFNPVKHGLVNRITDWQFSSFHRDVRLGRLPRDWDAMLSLNAA